MFPTVLWMADDGQARRPAPTAYPAGVMVTLTVVAPVSFVTVRNVALAMEVAFAPVAVTV